MSATFPYQGETLTWVDSELNTRRVDWAITALQSFATETGQLREITTGQATEIGEDALDEIGGDMICDLMHLAASMGADPEHLLERARFHFEAEYDGEDV